MLVGFDAGSTYAKILYVVGPLSGFAVAYLLWRNFAGQVVADARAVKRKVRPEAPMPPQVSISEQIGASVSFAQDPGKPHRHLSKIEPRYEIRNDGDVRIRNVTTGVRRRGSARSYPFPWAAADIPPHKSRRGKHMQGSTR